MTVVIFKSVNKVSFISGIIKRFSLFKRFNVFQYVLMCFKSNSDVVILNHTKMST